MKYFITLLALLSYSTMWGNDGDTFVASSIEGDELVFSIISEPEKTCKVSDIISSQGDTLTIPSSVNGYTVVAIGQWAFFQSGKTIYYLPNTIKKIENRSFVWNYYLKEIDIPESVEIIEEVAFYECPKLAHVSFHEGLKRIGREAFQGCALTSIDLPQSLFFIGRDAFSTLPLATVTVRSSTPIAHDTKELIFDDDTYMSTTLYVPEGTTNSFKADDEWGRFRNIKEGEPLLERPMDIAYPEHLGRQYFIYGNPVTININFVNQRENPIYTISYIPIIDGVEGEEQTYEFPQPIAANGKPFTLPFTLPNFYERKEVNVLFDIVKMNGEAVDYGADIRPNTCGTACVYIPVLDHKVLIEDNTSTQCIWALRSNIGLETVKEKYGDKVIRASKHVGDIMWSHPFSYIPFTPTCQVEGNAGWRDETGDFHYYDPYYGEGSEPLGILDLVDKKIATPHFGKVKILSAQWVDAEQTEITIVTESTVNMSHYPKEDRLYLINYILVEDGLKGEGAEWEQLNGYAGSTVEDPNLQPLTELPYTITDMVYPDVAVGYYHNKLKESFIYGETHQQTYTLRLSELTQSLCQNKNKLSIVACLQDNKQGGPAEGTIIDIDKSSIMAHPSDVISIKQDFVAPHDVYDLSGRKVKTAASTLDGLPHGVYVVGGKKVVN